MKVTIIMTYFLVSLMMKMTSINNNFLKVSPTKITISKTKIDKYEHKGQISKWIFEFDQIYSSDSDFSEIFEVEIYSSDFLTSCPLNLPIIECSEVPIK